MKSKIILIALIVTVFSSLFFFKLTDKTKNFPLKHPSLLFVQSISSGKFDGRILYLKEENPLILYFGDRPSRFSGHMTKKRFLKLWRDGSDSFEKNPPNAVLSLLTDESVSNVVVELFSPIVDGSTWKYGVKILSGDLPETFLSASLFIDAFPTSVNSEITDTISQTNVKVLGDAPAVSMGNLYQATSQALGNAAHNATMAQQQTNVTAQAATTQGVALLYSLDTASTGVATMKILQ